MDPRFPFQFGQQFGHVAKRPRLSPQLRYVVNSPYKVSTSTYHIQRALLPTPPETDGYRPVMRQEQPRQRSKSRSCNSSNFNQNHQQTAYYMRQSQPRQRFKSRSRNSSNLNQNHQQTNAAFHIQKRDVFSNFEVPSAPGTTASTSLNQNDIDCDQEDDDIDNTTTLYIRSSSGTSKTNANVSQYQLLNEATNGSVEFEPPFVDFQLQPYKTVKRGKRNLSINETCANSGNLHESNSVGHFNDLDVFHFGYISSIFEDKGHGFVTFVDDPREVNGAMFNYDDILKHLGIAVGDRVKYRLQINPRNNKKLAVDLSLAPKETIDINQSKSVTTGVMLRYETVKDVVVDEKSNRFCGIVFVDNKSYKFYFNEVNYGGWLPKKGDRVSFSLRPNMNQKMRMHDASLEQCVPRNDADIKSFFENIIDQFDADKNDLVHIFYVPISWAIIGKWNHLDKLSLLKVLRFLVDIYPTLTCHIHPSFRESLLNFMHEVNFNCSRGAFRDLLTNTDDLSEFDILTIKCFCSLITAHIPERCRLLFNIIESFAVKHLNIKELLELVQAVCSKSLVSRTVDINWHELPIALKPHEIQGTDSLEFLPAIKIKEPYQNPEEYLDTNFRLLRADCFEKLKEGIRNFKNNSLDSRNMTVYHKVSLVGVNLTRKELSLAIRLEPFNYKGKNWQKSHLLMFGNLLCLSFDNKFMDFVWVTVSSREVELLKREGIIFVSICSEANVLTDVELLYRLMLAPSTLWMAESPTYFQAYRHVIKSLQNMKNCAISMSNELVGCDFSDIEINSESESKNEQEVEADELPQAGLYCFRIVPPVLLSKTLITDHDNKLYNKTLDESQFDAFTNCVNRKIHIVQGPPGCGKTYVGTHVIHRLKKDQNRQGPILLVTYKNNSLDEFVRKLNELYVGEVKLLRFGGRSRKSELDSLNIREERRNCNLGNRSASEIIYKIECSIETLNTVFTSINHIYLTTFNAEFLAEFWLEEDRKLFEKQYASNQLKKYSGKNKKCQSITLELLLKIWLPSPDEIEVIKQRYLKLVKTESVLIDESLQEDNEEIDDIQEERKRERQSAAEMTGEIKEVQMRFVQATHPFQLDKRLIAVTKVKWTNLKFVADRWHFSSEDKFFYMQGCLYEYIEKKMDEQKMVFERDLNEYNRLKDLLVDLDIKKDVSICTSGNIDVIAMTITGASINNQFLQQLRPSCIVVEEAAEIMEPMLLGCLGTWCTRLYMIGDHFQLRPSVENFKLVKNCHLDVSMMERLINNNFPYDCLQYQNRMRPDISKYLRIDLYKDLKDNLSSVEKHQIPFFMTSSVFFWNVNYLERTERSCFNEDEARLTIKLACFFLQQGYTHKQITILTPYQGQVGLLRKYLRQELTMNTGLKTQDKSKYEDDDMIEDPNERKREDIIKIFSIDFYQGDENDIILVSLVRSNKEGQLGFLKTLNRRCVAQSRSRCCLVFIGNAETMDACGTWKVLLDAMRDDGLVQQHFPVECKTHHIVQEWKSMQDIPKDGAFCTVPCQSKMECGNEHFCEKLCQPFHKHDFCTQKLKIELKCGHVVEKVCHQRLSDVICKFPCEKELDCGHKCKRKCFEFCSSHYCTENVQVSHSCGHVLEKLCNQPVYPKCQVSIVKRLNCGHQKNISCFQSDELLKCLEDCTKTLTCGHACRKKCYEVCDPKSCIVDIETVYPDCRHKVIKKCGEDFKLCNKVTEKQLPCGHFKKAKCHLQKNGSLVCSKQCDKTLPCGHKCKALCGEACSSCDERVKRPGCHHEAFCWQLACECVEKRAKSYNCGHTESILCCREQRLVSSDVCNDCFKTVKTQFLVKQRELLEQKMQAFGLQNVIREPLTEADEKTSREYITVFDRIMRYIKSEHQKQVRSITSIEKITNIFLEKRMIDYTPKLFDKEAKPELFFHGTAPEVAEAIIKDGFRCGTTGMYGAGIYFATDTTKSVAYCKYPDSNGDYSLLLCEVLLGKSKVYNSPQNGLNFQTVNGMGYDSVFAKRNTKGTGGVLNDEYIIYAPEQAVPKYLIKFRS